MSRIDEILARARSRIVRYTPAEAAAADVVLVDLRSQDDRAFGATKLNNLLYFSDFQAYGALERSITGATYQRLDHGPAPRELLATIPLRSEPWVTGMDVED